MAYIYDFDSSLSLLLPALLVLILFFFFFQKKIRFDAAFLSAIVPFAVLGAAIRSLADKGILPYGGNWTEPGFWTHTPGLWILGGLLICVCLVLFPRFFKETFPEKMRLLGIGLALPAVLMVLFTGFPAKAEFLLVLGFTLVPILAWIAIERRIERKSNPFFSDPLNFSAFFANAIDGAASLVAFGFQHCVPKHELTATLFSISPVVFVLGKIAFVLLCLLVIEWFSRKILKNAQFEGLSKIFICLLFAITGIRTWLFIGSGLCALQ